MKTPLVGSLLIVVLLAASPPPAITENVTEARIAFEYLNQIRKNPSAHSTEVGINLRGIHPREALVWNDTLYKVALAKARDMAKRNYFGHVDPDGNGLNILIHRAGYALHADWIKNRKENFFESIGAGYADGKQLIRELIVDKGVNPPGHRHHLLGVTEFHAPSRDGAIAFVNCQGCRFPSYAVIVIARHGF